MEHAFPLDGFQRDNRTTFSIFQLYRGLRCRPIEVTCSLFNVYRWQVSSFHLIAGLTLFGFLHCNVFSLTGASHLALAKSTYYFRSRKTFSNISLAHLLSGHDEFDTRLLRAQYYGAGNWHEKRNGLKFSCFLSTPSSWNKQRWSHLPFASCAFNFCLIATVRVQILEIKLTVRVLLLPQKFTLALLQAMTPFCLIISGDKAKLPRW